MKRWIVAMSLVGIVLLVVGSLIVPIAAHAQATQPPTRQPPPPPPPPRPQPTWKPEPRPPVEKGPSPGRTLGFGARQEYLDEARARAERVVHLAQELSADMERVGAPKEYRDLGAQFDRLGADMQILVHQLQAMNERAVEASIQREPRSNREAAMNGVLEEIIRVLRETERLQGTLTNMVLP